LFNRCVYWHTLQGIHFDYFFLVHYIRMGNVFTGFNRETFFTNHEQASLLAPGRYVYEGIYGRSFTRFNLFFFNLSIITSLVFLGMALIDPEFNSDSDFNWLIGVNIAWLLMSLLGAARFYTKYQDEVVPTSLGSELA